MKSVLKYLLFLFKAMFRINKKSVCGICRHKIDREFETYYDFRLLNII